MTDWYRRNEPQINMLRFSTRQRRHLLAQPPGIFGHLTDTKRRSLLFTPSPISKCMNVLILLARPKRFKLLTPKFVVWCSIDADRLA